MYRRELPGQIKLDIPFNVKLNPDSAWVRLAELIPWERIEEEYANHFHGSEGQVAKSARLAFAALYIQTTEGFTDIKTMKNIQENPHMQYFCGFTSYDTQRPFDASLMVHFRKRIPAETVMKITEEIFAEEALRQMDAPEPEAAGDEAARNAEGTQDTENRGTLILDATCCPQDIQYPTDIGLLNHARELSEQIIDKLYKRIIDRYEYKPRTYRKVARKDYLSYTRTRKHSAQMIRSHVRKQLQYVGRDLRIIDDLIARGAPLSALPDQLYKKLLIVSEVYRQQKEMYDNKTHQCDARIVSITQPHVRPIVRGKEHTPVEFGSKVAIGLIGGYAFITDIAWENIAEAGLLPMAADKYKRMFGFYPKAIIGDGVYPNRENRGWCKERGIRLSGPKLGRKDEGIRHEEAKQIHQDGCERNAVEGEFGVVKRKFCLDRVMAKLSDTSRTAVAMGFFAANMERKLRLIFEPDSISFVYYDFDLLSLAISTFVSD